MTSSIYIVVCCFNDTAPTEIYTYLHTLSLHDALPILHPDQRDFDHRRPDLPRNQPVQRRYPPRDQRRPVGEPRRFGRTDQGDEERSEEHTSELQSLMRISYAVFCLKQKKRE